MKHHTDFTSYPELFAQGASEVVSDGVNQVALWTENTPYHLGKQIATIGGCVLVESSDSVTLLNYVMEYLSEEGFSTIVAPMNGSTWLEHRVVTYSDGSPSFALEPNTPPHWIQIFREAGFETLSEYSSSRLEIGDPNPRFQKLERKLEQKGIVIRAMDPGRFEQDLSDIYDLSVESFQHNFLYTHLPKELFIGKYQQAKSMLDPELVLLAESSEGLAGFVFCYPDQVNPRTLIVKTLASSSQHGFSGIGNLLVETVQNIAKKKGYIHAIHALQFQDNSSLRITSRYNPTVIRKYALLAKYY